HRTVEEELLSKCSDIKEFSERLLDYIEWYNTERPHWGIELRIPAEVYFADFKSMDELLSPAGIHEVP
ncbi:MAG: IS3 family transposase, partial [Thermoplasmata archaeon]